MGRSIAQGFGFVVRQSASGAALVHRVMRRARTTIFASACSASLDPQTGEAVGLEFCLVVPNGALPSVEDARANWSPHESTVVPVATIEIPPQDASSAERMEHAERMVFTPWHTLRAHRPLGSLSRARLAVYRESVEHRSLANREVPLG